MRHRCFLGTSPQGFHKLAYTEWGDRHNPRVVLCVHGLTRNRWDFLWLADHLQADYRVVALDIVGRGDSDRFSDPLLYHYPQYLADIAVLLGRLDAEELFWVGTSMGGLLGIQAASFPGSPIRKMVLNDIGPFVSKGVIKDIGDYASSPPFFDTPEDATSYLKKTYRGYEGFSPQKWQTLTNNSIVWNTHRHAWQLHYDPGLAHAFTAAKGKSVPDLDFWGFWDKISCPCLAFRGEISSVFAAGTAEKMMKKPGVQVISFPNQGHPLSLATPHQIELIHRFLKD